MKWYKIVILAVVLVILILGYVWDRNRIKRERALEEAQKKVFPWRVEELTEVHVSRPSGSLRLIRPEGGEWRIVEPLEARADQDGVERFLETLLGAQRERQVEERTDELEDYGLQLPPVIITMKVGDADGAKVLQIGKQNPTESYYYARLKEEDSVFLVLNVIHEEAGTEIFDLREKSLWNPAKDRIKEVFISSGDERIRLTRHPDDGWRIEEPEALPADGDSVKEFVSKLSELEAVAFADETSKAAELGLKPPETRIVFRMEEPEEEMILLVGGIPAEREDKGDRRYVRVEGQDQIALVEASSLEGLSTELFHWRQKALLTFEPYRVQEFRIRRPGDVLMCSKKGGDRWQIEQPRQVPANISRVYDILWALKKAEAVGFPETPPPGISWDEPVVEVTIRLDAVDDPLELVIAQTSSEAESLYARAPAQEDIVAVHSALLEELDIPFEELREKRLLWFDVQAVRRIRVVWEEQIREAAFEDEKWVLKLPKEERLDQNDVLDLLWSLLDMEFVEELLERPAVSVVDRKPRISVLIWNKEQQQIGSLYIGNGPDERSGVVYAWTGEEDSPVYLVDDKIIAELKSGLEKVGPDLAKK